MKRILLICLCLLLLAGVGFGANIYLIGEPVDGDQLHCETTLNGSELTLRLSTAESAVGLTGCKVNLDGDVLHISTRKVLVSPLHPSGSVSTTVGLYGASAVYVGGKLVWSAEETTPSPFDFPLPAGFSIANITETTCDLLLNGQAVGGFVITELGSGIFDNVDGDVIREYLATYVQEPLVFDYIFGYAQNNPSPIAADLIVVDLEKETSHEFDHYLFKQGEDCYDLWLDTELIDGKATVELLNTTGIDVNVEYVDTSGLGW